MSNVHIFRLTRGLDLIDALAANVPEGGEVVAAVGCVTRLVLRNNDGKTVFESPFEIITLRGPLNSIQVVASDEQGKVISGTLEQGSVVGITCEVTALH